MNILPKKKWHVRTKENMARVRRDEAKAADEQRRIDERAVQADHEDRIRRLQKKAADREESMFGLGTSEPSTLTETSVDATGHVNFFAELEKRETQNTTSGNKDLEAEKKKERDEWETKMGILTYLGGNTNELTKQKSWYEGPFDRDYVKREEAANEKKKQEEVPKAVISKSKGKEEKKKKRRLSHSSDSEERSRSHRKSKKKKKRRHRSPSTESESENEKKKRLQRLREDRVRREQEERLRTEKLLNPTPVKKEPAARDKPKFERKYNSQFNPEFARQNFSRDH